MPVAFQKVILFGKRHRDQIVLMTIGSLIDHLERNNPAIDILIEQETAEIWGLSQRYETVSEEQLAQHSGLSLMIVIGGDGSLLSAARLAVSQNLAVLGINRGRLGFLTDIAPGAFEEIDKILAGFYQEEKRFLLQAEIHDHTSDQILYSSIALNDVVLLPGDIAHMIEFSIEINQEFMCVQRADGLIVATPTGSTAYALSGGGPILHPQLEAVVLVPMFPHKLTSRPIVVSSSSRIKISLHESLETLPCLSCDGQKRMALSAGDSIIINKLEKYLHLIHPVNYEYFVTLRDKLQWESRSY